MNQIKNLGYVYDDGDTLYLTDGSNYYGLNYHDIDKSELREYANVEPTEVEKDEDGDLCYYYDDDSWEVDYEILEEYIKDYITSDCDIYESGDSPAASQGAIFKIYKGDNGWYETLINFLKTSSPPHDNNSGLDYDDGYEDFVDERPHPESPPEDNDDSFDY